MTVRHGDLHAREGDSRPAIWNKPTVREERPEERVDGSSVEIMEQLAASIVEAVRSVAAGVPRLSMKPDEAAATLGVSRDFFDHYIAGELRWVRRGRLKLVSVRELERWLEREGERTLDRRGTSAG